MTDDPFDVEPTATADASSVDETSGIYANQDKADAKGVSLNSVSGDSSDEIDPRKLVRDPSLSELRWYYRRTFAKMLVDKPIDDAFKNGFEITSSNATEAERLLDEPRFGKNSGFEGAYKLAQKKARRDGFALIFIGTKDSSDGVHVSPIPQDVRVDEISHLKVLTIDDLTQISEGAVMEQVEEGTGLEPDNFVVRETGIVINTDITSPDYRTPVGYILDGAKPTFVHADRVLHYTWNQEVDGDFSGTSVRRWKQRSNTLGLYEGDSILIQSYDLLKGLVKGNWAVMQALFRNASHMYTVTLPEDADQDEFDIAHEETKNINAKSAFTFPHGYEMNQYPSGDELDPRNHYDVIFDQICAAHEMSRSVLFGTQSGTVSGSETDIKNYFNQVERFRTERATEEINEYLTRIKRIKDGRTSRDFHYDVEVEWGPLFKVDEETRMQMLQTTAQGLGSLIGQYVLTPDEAREFLTNDWVEFDLDDLTDEQMDVLDRLNLAQVGQYQGAEANDPTPDVGGQQGGRPEGARQEEEGSATTPTQ